MTARQYDLILGTAGHIDHGKSALVMALTGTDPDRLAEEKERGITIKLGFAQLQLANGRTMGVVDVPGHERFVRQMIAGATGVDVALLVIAADDGIMPQTVEHLAVLQTLGIRTLVVALTKTDLVDADWIGFVSDEVESHLAQTPYAGAPIVAVSSKTGQGLEELRKAIQKAAENAEHVIQGSAARLPIDRAFTIKGAGTVVTGTLWSGTVKPGDELEVLPGEKTYRVRSVQIHNAPAEQAHAGNRVALNLADVSTSEIGAGDFLCTPGSTHLTDRFDCALTYLDTAKRNKPLETGARMHVAHGTREIIGRVLLCDGREKLMSGETAYAQIRLEEPLPICMGDRFVVRTYSPTQVAGGGIVLLAHPRRRTNLDDTLRALLDALHDDDFDKAVHLAVATQSAPTTAEQLGLFIGTDPAHIESALAVPAKEFKIARFGKQDGERFYVTEHILRRLEGAVERTLIRFHSDNPTEAGMAKEALRRKCFPHMTASCFDALVEHLSASGAVVSRNGLVGHPSAQSSVQQALDNTADALAALLAEQGMAPESLSALAKSAGVTQQQASKALGALVEAGRVYRVSSDLFFDAAAIALAKEAVVEHLRAGNPGTAAALKEAMHTSRKFAMPLLEKFDVEGLTKRIGDERVLGSSVCEKGA